MGLRKVSPDLGAVLLFGLPLPFFFLDSLLIFSLQFCGHGPLRACLYIGFGIYTLYRHLLVTKNKLLAGFNPSPIAAMFGEGFMDSQSKLFGRRVRSIRRAAKITQEDAAERAHLNAKYLGELERGEKRPSFEAILAL